MPLVSDLATSSLSFDVCLVLAWTLYITVFVFVWWGFGMVDVAAEVVEVVVVEIVIT